MERARSSGSRTLRSRSGSCAIPSSRLPAALSALRPSSSATRFSSARIACARSKRLSSVLGKRASSRGCLEDRGSHRGLVGAAPRGGAVEVAGALFEGADHAAHRLAEQHLDKLLHQSGFEFEIDIEIDMTAARYRLEDPVVVEAAKRPLC